MTNSYENMLIKAVKVSDDAYCPYSEFAVGAVLVARNKAGEEKTFAGFNIENSSYSMTMCAERVAAGQAIVEGYYKFSSVAIVARNRKNENEACKPCNPCGACLQVLSEFGPEMEVILENKDNTPLILTLKDFLPRMFTPEDLGVRK